MAYELRFPNITGATTQEQMAQMRSYIHQLVDQLNWALNHIDSSSASYVVNQKKGSTNQTSSTDAKVAFDALKPLIIKSADIVQAYYEKINSKLVGNYVAYSDFGTFMEQTEQDLIQSSTNIEQLFTNLQQIITDIEDLNFNLVDVNAHIRSGLLYYDESEVPVYGLEIGQKTTIDGVEVFNKFARFTADRLSFYDQNDSEVAYISDYKLYIRNVQIKGSFQEGGYKDFIDSNGGIVTKWVGGD